MVQKVGCDLKGSNRSMLDHKKVELLKIITKCDNFGRDTQEIACYVLSQCIGYYISITLVIVYIKFIVLDQFKLASLCEVEL